MQATIVKCQTHSTQTHYSHLRSEIQCQTVEPRHKCLQTKKETGVNTPARNYFLWGLRAQPGYGQHIMDHTDYVNVERKKGKNLACEVSCVVQDRTKIASIATIDAIEHVFNVANSYLAYRLRCGNAFTTVTYAVFFIVKVILVKHLGGISKIQPFWR
jgi:hypothetical protein